MADRGNSQPGGAEGGSWWGGWLAAAKHQTERALEMVSADLQEFTSTMQSDTKKVVEKTKETIQKNTQSDQETQPSTGERVKKGFFSLMDGITKALTIDPEDTSPPARGNPQQPAHGIFDRSKIRLRAVQVDTGTYLNEPAGSAELYADWLKTFDIEAHKGEISDLLVSMVEVRSLYTSLVPSEVSHQDFWWRYFYRVHQLKLDEARKQALMKRAEQAQVKEDSINWDEEEWSGDEENAGNKHRETKVNTEDLNTCLKQQTEATVGAVTETSDGAVTETTDGAVTENTDGAVTETTDGAVTETTDGAVTETTDGVVKQNEKTCEKKHEHSYVNSTPLSTLSVENGVNTDNALEKNPADVSCDNIEYESAKQQNVDTADVVEVANIADKAISEETPMVAQHTLMEETQGGNDRKTVIETTGCDKSVIVCEEHFSANKVPAVTQATEPDKIEMEKIYADVSSTINQALGEMKETLCDVNVESEKTMESSGGLPMKVKEDIVVVGDRISPTSDSSGTKGSSSDDWEKDFDDVEVTAEDLKAAQELASKLNMSAAEYNTLTGGNVDGDWENWD
ncbi:BSD domain-containing protein 1-A-like isoform X2 [Dreissena polymorpha]|uniref:BSD domain-containing protein n=1 Tax=Dreissena polymorpha TaxID=45954 RepID=A0A9D4HAL0_DREPO|nr:BSD domain-containing protein 1-A-like isoform X2 [Dreissena polymorpha]KAH3831623.1 hypothetical protein DPMN_104893 [Dreissena polymorpha]